MRKVDAVARKWAERGITVKTASSLGAAPIPEPPPLIAENVLAFDLFFACQTQVLLGGLGVVTGVSHDTLEWKMRIRGVTEPDEQLELEEKFRRIEAVYVKSCNARMKK